VPQIPGSFIHNDTACVDEGVRIQRAELWHGTPHSVSEMLPVHSRRL